MMDKSHLMPGVEYGHSHHEHQHEADQAVAHVQEHHNAHFDVQSVRGANSIVEMNPGPERRRRPRKLVLCFDGTGNKFRGDESDSNILKIFRMLDRTANDQCKSFPAPYDYDY
jgi:hypothetical protein